MTIFSWVHKVKMVIKLYKKHTPTKEIASQLNMSLRDVYKIIKKEFGEKDTEQTNELKALKLFRQGKRAVEVAIALRIPSEEAMQYCIKYNDLVWLGNFQTHYKRVKGNLKELLEIAHAMREGVLTAGELVQAANMTDTLVEMQSHHLSLSNVVAVLEERKSKLDFEIELLEIKKAELTNTYTNYNYRNYNYPNNNFTSPY